MELRPPPRRRHLQPRPPHRLRPAAPETTCSAGLVLRPGDSCTYPGTSQRLTINADGTATFAFVTSGSAINIVSPSLTLVAIRQSDGSWIIQRVANESVNEAPRAVGNIPDQTLTAGDSATTVDVSANFADPDGDALSYAATSSRTAVLRVSVSGSEVSLTPVGEGAAAATVTATDPEGLSAKQTFLVAVTSANRAPVAVGMIPDQTLTEGGNATTIDVSDNFEDPDGDDLTFRASSSRTSVVRVGVSGSEVILTPEDEGRATVTVTATDPDGRSGTQRFAVTVEPGMTGDDCAIEDLGTLRGTATRTRSGSLGRDCESPNESGKLARYYSFRVSGASEVRIDLESSAFDAPARPPGRLRHLGPADRE